MTNLMKTVPVIREAGYGEEAGYLFSFGAYGTTHVAVLGGSLEDGLEACQEWLDDNAPGLLHTVSEEDYADAAKELGLEWPSEDEDIVSKVTEQAEADMTMVGHTTLEHGNCIPSWEWHVRDLDAAELATLMHRFCRDCESELKENETTLCAGCIAFLVTAVASDLRVERAGLSPEDFPDEYDGCDVRLQVSKWGSDWAIRVGDASYDQDHRGDWGASSIRPDDTDAAIRSVAEDLVDQALEAAAMNEEA
jgi:hypothetical protein